MENNFNNNSFNRELPNSNSFQRRNDYNTSNSSFNQNNQNNFSQNGKPFKSIDGREWQTRDQSMVANKEYYRKIGRELNHKPDNPEAFNLNNFYKFNKD